MISHSPRGTVRGRSGFTLLELLIVIAIIAILMALTAAASLRVLSEQPRRNTELLVRKLQQAVDRQWTAAIDQAKRDRLSGNISRDQYVRTALREEFPISLSEAQARYGPHVAGVQPPPVDGADSAICLYLILGRARDGQEFNADIALGAAALKDLDGARMVRMVIDGWGNPVSLVRAVDPSSPYGMQPVIVSPGPDGRLGLSRVDGRVLREEDTYDNIDSRDFR
ncbi:MAG: prepilin-type N-terminal cleavage/methylation domain-containing protein [Gemmataceae bacterium]